MKLMWVAAIGAIGTVTAAIFAYLAGSQYISGMLMFIATVTVLGLSMNIEDRLLAKYDTPHDDDHHPPPPVGFRALRAIVLMGMGVAIFVMVIGRT